MSRPVSETEFSETESSETESSETDSFSDSPPICFKDGFVVIPRPEIPKKDFDFSHVPKFSRNDTAAYAFRKIMYDVPWCGPGSGNRDFPWELKADAQFILLTESADTFVSLFSNNFHITHKFVLVKGTADECTCYFLRMLKRELRIPIFALVDYDPMSLKLLNFYETWAPEAGVYFSAAQLDIKWLGIRNLPLLLDNKKSLISSPPCTALTSGDPSCLAGMDLVAEMDDHDLTVANSLLNTKFVNKSEQRVAEVKRMIDMKLIMEVIALGVYFLLDMLPSIFEDLLNEKESGKTWI